MASIAHTPPIPGSPPMPLFGSRGNFIRFLNNPVGEMVRIFERFGALASLTAGDPTQFIAVGPEYNRLLLSDADTFHTIFETITPPYVKARRRGVGLLNMNGAEHKQQRRLMMPAFHRKQVAGYRDVMVSYADEALSRWRPGQRFDLVGEMNQLTLRIACKTLFGLDVAERAPVIGALVKRFLRTNLFAPQVALLPFDVPGTPYHRMMRTNARLEDEILTLIARKRASGHDEGDVLAMLIHARDEDGTAMTDRELIGQTSTLLIAGHETSSNSLTWTLFLLSQHPEVYADLVDELDGVLGGAAPTVEQLAQLPLLERVVKESLRLLPPAALASRISTAPFQLGPYDLPSGTFVTISQFLTHRLPELYGEPQRFMPERWEHIDPSPYEYIPFGAGPRMCIGASFAMMEIRLVLAMLLQRFRLDLAPDARVDQQVKITLSPRHGMSMVVAARNEPWRSAPARGGIRRYVDLP